MVFDLSDLTEESAREAMEQLLAQLENSRRAVDLYKRQAAGIRKMIDGLVEIVPALEDLLPEDLDDDEEPRPRGAEAVRRVLIERGGEWLTVPAVVNRLERNNWMPKSSNPANAVRSALERLVEIEVAEKERSGEGAVIYRYKEEPF